MSIRVLVVEDSLTVRRRLVEVLESDPAFEVVGEAADGARAIELCLKLRPSVLTMDMMLPVMSGLAATEYIMAHCPTPILIVSSSLNRGELFQTYEALAAGAVDVLDKPRGDDSDEAWTRTFLSRLKLVSRIKVITHPRARMEGYPHAPAPPRHATVPADREERKYGLLAIGASLGGPGAVLDILKGIPAGFSLPVLLVLHIGEPFGGALAEWLDGLTPHSVSCARDGQPLSEVTGKVIMAPPNRHLIVSRGILRLTMDPERHSCRPSVDVLFESLAQECGASTAAALLTGMGRDGAAGLLKIRQAGGLTLAQDEATSTVYGMPKEAALLGAACRILPLDEIGRSLAWIARGGPG